MLDRCFLPVYTYIYKCPRSCQAQKRRSDRSNYVAYKKNEIIMSDLAPGPRAGTSPVQSVAVSTPPTAGPTAGQVFDLQAETSRPAAKTQPLYQQVKNHIIERIESGEWPPERRTPSENELVEALSVSRMTANRALRELTAEGYLVRVQGVGTFVAARKSVSASRNTAAALNSSASS